MLKLIESKDSGFCQDHNKPYEFYCLTDKVEICSVCGLFAEHKFHDLIIKKELPLIINELVDQTSNELKKFEILFQIKNHKTLDSFLTEKFDVSVESKRKQLKVIYKQLKSILKETIFSKLEEVEKQHKRMLKTYFGENLISFEKLKKNLENISGKIETYKNSKNQNNYESIATFLEMDNIKNQSKNLVRMDGIFRNIKNKFTELKLDATLNLANINSLIDFKCKELVDSDLEKFRNMINDCSVKKIELVRSSKKIEIEEEYLNDIDLTDIRKNETSLNKFRKSTSNTDFVHVSTLVKFVKQNKPQTKSDYDIKELPLTLTKNTIHGSKKSVLNPTLTEQLHSRDNEKHVSSENNMIDQFVQSNQISEYALDFRTMGPVKSLTSLMASKFSEKRHSVRSTIQKGRLYSINDQTALVTNQTITEKLMFEIVSQIIEKESKVTSLLFCRNFFTFDTISFLLRNIQDKLPRILTIDIGNNTFSKDHVALKSEIYALEKKNIRIRN